jgi:hypothetical protein
MLGKLKYLIAIIILGAGFHCCVKKKTYSQSPQLEFKNFYPFQGDSADMVIGFSDGDGDIGKAAGDTTRNLWMNYYYKDTLTGKYVAWIDPFAPTSSDSLRTGYTIRKPADDYEGKPISGEVSVRIHKYRHSKKIKAVKYVIYMYDNKGNKSNVVTTPELFVP